MAGFFIVRTKREGPRSQLLLNAHIISCETKTGFSQSIQLPVASARAQANVMPHSAALDSSFYSQLSFRDRKKRILPTFLNDDLGQVLPRPTTHSNVR
jgi:hypothetical protein